MSSSDEDDEFFNRISRKTPFSKLARVSLGSDQKVKKDEMAFSPETKLSTSSTRKSRNSEAKWRRRPHITDGDSEQESDDDFRHPLYDHCGTRRISHQMSQNELNDHANDLTDSSDQDSPTTRTITSKRYPPQSSQSMPTEVFPPTAKSMTANVGRHSSSVLSEVESQPTVTTPNSLHANFIDDPKETGDRNSDGDQSVDTLQLTRRLRANLGAKHGNSQTIHRHFFLTKSPSPSTGQRDDSSSPSADARIVNRPTNSKELLTPCQSHHENSVGEQSVDTVQLTRRLKVNLASKLMDSASMQNATKDSTCVPKMPVGNGLTNIDVLTVTLPRTCKDRLPESDEENSIGEESLETAVLTRRLKGRLGIKHIDIPANPTAACASAKNLMHHLTPTDAPLCTVPTKSKEISSPSDDGNSEGEQSVDTVQLTSRLRANLGTRTDDLPPTQMMARKSVDDSHVPREVLANSADAHRVNLPRITNVMVSHRGDEQLGVERSADVDKISHLRETNLPTMQGCLTNLYSTTSLMDHRHMNSPPDHNTTSTCERRPEATTEYGDIIAEGNDVTTRLHPAAAATSSHQNNLLSLIDTTVNSEPQGGVREPASGILEFRLPSQSESSSDEDTVSDEDDEEERDRYDRLNPNELSQHTLATLDERPENAVPALPSRCMQNLANGSTRTWNRTAMSSDDNSMSTNRCNKSYNTGAKASDGQKSVGRIKKQRQVSTDWQKNEQPCQMTEMEQLPSRNNQDNATRQTNYEVPSRLPHSRELYDAAFGDFDLQDRRPQASSIKANFPSGPHVGHGKGSQISAVENPDEIGDEELFREAFVANNGNLYRSSNTFKNPCIMLLDSDSDESESRQNQKTSPFRDHHPRPPLVHAGLRTTRQSPRFNIASRVFPKRLGALDAPIHDDIADDDDDADNQDNHQAFQSGARRVTQDHALFIRRNRPPSLDRDESVGMVGNVPAASTFDLAGESSVGVSGLTRPWRRSSRPRIRDAAASNPLNAASATSTRSLRQRQAPVVVGPPRFGTFAVAQQRQSLQQHRNDIHGGSGAGVAGLSFRESRTPLQKGPIDEAQDSSVLSGSDEAPTRRPAKRKKRDSRRKSSGIKRGRKTAKSSSKRGGWSARKGGRGKRGVQGTVWGDETGDTWNRSEAFTREDPVMKQIGGAEITF